MCVPKDLHRDDNLCWEHISDGENAKWPYHPPLEAEILFKCKELYTSASRRTKLTQTEYRTTCGGRYDRGHQQVS